MNKKYILLLLLIFTAVSNKSQSISSARSNTYKNYHTKYGNPLRIKEITTFYNKNISSIKEIIEFSKNSDTIVIKKYKKNKLNSQIKFIFNDDKKLIFRTCNVKVPLLGWKYEESKYKYENNGLIEIFTTDGNNNLINLAKFKCDSIGNPLKLSNFDNHYNLIGYETAEYFYNKNKWTHRIFNVSGDTIYKKNFVIETVKSQFDKYNEHGDLVYYPKNGKNENKGFSLIKYKYDKLGNWIQKKYYNVIQIDGEIVSKELHQKIKRKIKYRY